MNVNMRSKRNRNRKALGLLLAVLLLAITFPLRTQAAEEALADSRKLDGLLRSMTEEDRSFLTNEAAYVRGFKLTPEDVLGAQTALAELTAGMKTDGERVQVVCQWIAQAADAENDSESAEENTALPPVLLPEKLMTGNSAELLAMFLRMLDIPAVCIDGVTVNEPVQAASDGREPDVLLSSSGLMESAPHRWNAVYVDGTWRYYDIVRGADYCKVSVSRMAEVQMPRAFNQIENGAFSYKGTGYRFEKKDVLENVLIQTLPETATTRYTVRSDVSGYPVAGFDQKSIVENAAWETITTLTFANGMNEIPAYSCLGMKSLKTVVIGEGTTKIGAAAFADCASLKNVVLPSTLKELGEEVFYGCNLLKSIELPKGLKKIGDYAFSCSGLVEMTLPSTVKTLGKYVFYGCRSLEYLKLSYGMDNVPIGTAKSCTALKTVVMPSKAVYIGKEAFYGCASLSSVKVPDQVDTIYSYAFANCYSLKKLTFGERVQTVGKTVLVGCENLTKLVAKGAKPPKLTKNFYLCQKAGVQVPEGRLNVYKKAFSASAYVKKYQTKIGEYK